MKAAIYNPYLDTLGGGERYVISFAKVLFDKGYRVDIQWKDAKIKKELEQRFGIDLMDLNIVKNIKRGDGYDVCFWVSDGSVPLMRARNNILHFQMPFMDVDGRSLLNRMKFFRINKVVCNSEYTKNFIDEEYPVESIVIYPPVDVEKFSPKRKQNYILSVGRFSQLTQAKGQDVLITAFKKMVDRGLNDWRLVLAGGTEIGSDQFLIKLKKLAGGYPIEIIESPDFKKLVDLYSKAKIYWSASGYGVDDRKDPKKAEHFGISIVEAMASGAYVLAFNSGGHKEIITQGEDGYLWDNTRSLIKQSEDYIKYSTDYNDLIEKAIKSTARFSYENFTKRVSLII